MINNKNKVRESNPGHIGGKQALSPLRQPWNFHSTKPY